MHEIKYIPFYVHNYVKIYIIRIHKFILTNIYDTYMYTSYMYISISFACTSSSDYVVFTFLETLALVKSAVFI